MLAMLTLPTYNHSLLIAHTMIMTCYIIGKIMELKMLHKEQIPQTWVRSLFR